MEKEKSEQFALQDLERRAWGVLCLTKSPSQYVVKEMLTLLKWYKVDLEKYRLKADRLRKWEEILRSNVQPPSYQKWSDEDEAKLVDLRRKEIKPVTLL